MIDIAITIFVNVSDSMIHRQTVTVRVVLDSLGGHLEVVVVRHSSKVERIVERNRELRHAALVHECMLHAVTVMDVALNLYYVFHIELNVDLFKSKISNLGKSLTK